MKLDCYFPLVKSGTKQKGIAQGFAVCLTLLFLLQKLFITMDLNVKKKINMVYSSNPLKCLRVCQLSTNKPGY